MELGCIRGLNELQREQDDNLHLECLSLHFTDHLISSFMHLFMRILYKNFFFKIPITTAGRPCTYMMLEYNKKNKQKIIKAMGQRNMIQYVPTYSPRLLIWDQG